MAILNGNVIGNLSARTVDGRTIMAARPSSFTVNHNPAVTEIRQKFACTVNLSKNILSLPALEAIWKTVKGSGISVFNTIFKSNFAYTSAEKPTEDNIITPGGFSLPVDTVVVGVDKITGSILALDTEAVFAPDEVDASANALVCYFDPLNPADPAYQVIALDQEVPGYNFSQTYSLQMDFDARQKLVAAKYTKSILYLIVATKTAEGKVVQFSSTSPKLS